MLGATDKKRSEYAIVPPLQGPAGKQSLWWPILPSITMLITKNCKTPESAFMMGDLMATEEMSINNHYGEKGVDWKDPPANARGYVSGYEPLADPIVLWGTLQNKHWAENGPNLRGKKWAFPDMATDSPYDYVIAIGRGLPDAIKYGTKDPITGLIYNEQEQDVMNEFHATIITYVQESFARFVMGDLNIDRDWNAYVAEFDKMGLANVIRATQSAWDRMNK
jgi:putative aldouronate transport system substrate-binding protein